MRQTCRANDDGVERESAVVHGFIEGVAEIAAQDVNENAVSWTSTDSGALISLCSIADLLVTDG
jgi:hypothetical protein